MVRQLVRDIPTRRDLGPLPRRPRPRGRQLARGGRGRRAPGRVHDQRHRRARRQHLARGDRDGAQGAPRGAAARDRHPHASCWCRPAPSSPPSPASGRSPTRRSSAGTPSPTRPASTRTACSRNPLSYEIMTPASVGLSQSMLVLGKHSGRHARRVAAASSSAWRSSPTRSRTVTRKVKELADRTKFVYDEDLLAIVEHAAEPRARLVRYQVLAGNQILPTATVEVRGRGPPAHGLGASATGRSTPRSRRSTRRSASSCRCSRCTRGR